MNRPLPISISIPEPCNEDWDAMTPTEQGRFCDKCQKCVIDFTGWTDSQMYNYLSKNINNNICGQLNSTQLNRPILPPYQPNHIFNKYVAGIGLMLILTQAPTGKTFAKPPQTTRADKHSDNHNKQKNFYIRLEGTIRDEQNQPVANALITVNDSNNVIALVISNINGEYSVYLKQAKNYTIIISHPKFNTLTIDEYIVSNDIQCSNFNLTTNINAVQDTPTHYNYRGGLSLSPPKLMALIIQVRDNTLY